MNPSIRSLRALDWLNVFLADIRYGVTAFLAIYLLTEQKWTPAEIGLAIAIPSTTAIIFQSPAGAFIDQTKYKRLLIVTACILLATCCISLVFAREKIIIYFIQGLIGLITTIYTPAVFAITLGLVGNKDFPKRTGRNETFNHAGNVAITILAGVLGYYISISAVFYLMTFMCALSCIATLMIREKEIDHTVAREGPKVENHEKIVSVKALLSDKNILLFTIGVVLFYFANAAMFPILAQMFTIARPDHATLYTAGGIVIAEAVMIPVAFFTGLAASKGKRKYLFIIAFFILPIRALLYTFTNHEGLLLSIQMLDGAGAGIVKVISVIMIADLTRGTGRFNFMQGTVVTAIGIGTSLSDYATGLIIESYGYHAGFFFLSGIGLAGLIFFNLFVPETKDIRLNNPIS